MMENFEDKFYLGDVMIPSGWREREDIDYAGGGIFLINQDGVKLDIFETRTAPQLIKGIPCCSIKSMLDAKMFYDDPDDKHLLDIQYLSDHGLMQATTCIEEYKKMIANL